jgi:hypothetical protein
MYLHGGAMRWGGQSQKVLPSGCQALGVDRSATLDPVEVLQSAVFLESQGCDAAKSKAPHKCEAPVFVLNSCLD